MNSLVGRFSLQNVGQFETKILIKLCKLYLMASNNEIFDGIATTRISSTPELSAFIFRKQKKKLPELGGWVHCSSQQRDLLDQESLLATSCPIVRVSQKVATSIGKLYYVQCTILLWRTSIAPGPLTSQTFSFLKMKQKQSYIIIGSCGNCMCKV